MMVFTKSGDPLSRLSGSKACSGAQNSLTPLEFSMSLAIGFLLPSQHLNEVPHKTLNKT